MVEYIAKKELNGEKNGVEIYFNVFPITATRENLKKNGFKWNHKKKCWYAKQNTTTLSLASICAETTKEEYKHFADNAGEVLTDTKKTEKPEAKKTNAKPKTINLENLGEKPEGFSYYHSELSKLIREDLKRRGVDGVTVRAGRGGYTASITVTIKATADDIASIEEMKERYNYSRFTCEAERGFYDGEKWVYNFHGLTDEQKKEEYEKYISYSLRHVSSFSTHWNERKNCPELTTAFYNKCMAVFRIANQWNYDNSDSMTDYFDVGYYLDIDIKKADDFTPRESMTDAEKTAYAEELRQEEEERTAALAKYEQKQKEAEERRKAYEEQHKKDLAIIKSGYTVEDLPEKDQIFITSLVGGIGKESDLEDLENEIKEHPHYNDALITRKVQFLSREAFDLFTKYLLDDFPFLYGMGGTASEDSRLDESMSIYQLNDEQRESVNFFSNNCVAIYCGDSLELVSDPQGYNYSRYTYKLTEESKIMTASEELGRQRKESEEKAPLYFPEDVEKQAENLHEGQKITIYQTNGWDLCNVYGGAGEVVSVSAGDWAQYKGVFITLRIGKKLYRSFIRNGKKCLIYEGIREKLPESLTRRRISATMSEILNADEVFPLILEYYGQQEQKPLIDTIQR